MLAWCPSRLAVSNQASREVRRTAAAARPAVMPLATQAERAARDRAGVGAGAGAAERAGSSGRVGISRVGLRTLPGTAAAGQAPPVLHTRRACAPAAAQKLI